MSVFLKRVFMNALGLAAALMLWPFLLLLQYNQSAFPGFLAFSAVQGIVFGAVFGAVFGSFEGIAVSSRPKALSGMLFGALFGACAGVVGTLAGQGLLFAAGASVLKNQAARMSIGLSLARGSGWVIMGVLLAMTEGFRSRSVRKLLVGASGGAVGGILGGVALEALLVLFPGNGIASLAGLALFGLAVAFFYSMFENGFSAGTLKLLNGALKGKEYPLVSRVMTIGSEAGCDIVLKGYPGVDAKHAQVSVSKTGVTVKALGSSGKVFVNEAAPGQAPLRREDVVAVGKAKFIFGHFA